MPICSITSRISFGMGVPAQERVDHPVLERIRTAVELREVDAQHRQPQLASLGGFAKRAGLLLPVQVSMLPLFLEHPEAGSCSGLAQVVCSGEALGTELVAEFNGQLEARLENLYGPTEDTTYSTWAEVGRGEAISLKATLRPPPEPVQPNGFDFGRWRTLNP